MINKYCPLCGKENKCLMDSEEHGNCWCGAEEFPKAIFQLVPEKSRGKQCICKSCLTIYREEQKIKENR